MSIVPAYVGSHWELVYVDTTSGTGADVLSTPAPPPAPKMSLLQAALYTDDYESPSFQKILVRDPQRALHLAATCAAPKCIAAAVSAGADVNIATLYSLLKLTPVQTVLHVSQSTEERTYEAIKCLLVAGADPEKDIVPEPGLSVKQNDWTALNMAVSRELPTVVKLLRSYGATRYQHHASMSAEMSAILTTPCGGAGH